MKAPKNIPDNLLAPCGIDCMLCHHHCESDEPCLGCRGWNGKSEHCKNCDILYCTTNKGYTFCIECTEFPCKQLIDFNSFYIERYGHEFLPNAVLMKKSGKAALIEYLLKNWTHKSCGGIICIHDSKCSECDEKL